MEKEKMEETLGFKTKEFTLPSGCTITIREQNGDDDDIISNAALAKNGNHINAFISAITIKTNITTHGKLMIKDVMKMKIRDKYAILFMSRVFSLGAQCEFEYDWGKDNGGKVTYEDNLENYIWDYSKGDFPDPGHEDYFDQRIRPYINGNEDRRELELTSGKIISYEYLNGFSERYLLELPQEKLTKNAELKARNIEQKLGDKWVKIDNFRFFTPQDMKELRDDVKLYDPTFEGLMDIENPKTGNITKFPIILSPDFFFPGEI